MKVIKDEEREIVPFLAVLPISLGCWLEQKQAQKAQAAMSFLLFTLNS